MDDIVEISCVHGRLILRPERDDDRLFRFRLFCDSRAPEWRIVQIDPVLRSQLMQHQFQAQTLSYRSQFPNARFDIIELDGAPIGRIVVNRPGGNIHIVDQAIVPAMRNRGIGAAIMRTLLDEAARGGLPVRLQVSSNNDPSMRLYLRLGFVPIASDPAYVEMEWRALPRDRDGRPSCAD